MSLNHQPTIEEEYIAQRPKSAALARQALELFPSGVTHDVRYLAPFSPYIVRAQGCRKWDVDGHDYIDYYMGHGSLILGHGHPDVVQAVTTQLSKGTHYAANHELEIEWAKWVIRLMPSIEQLKFTNSGTESTMLAIRLARAHTGKTKILKFQNHFHGWHDYATVGMAEPMDTPVSLGVPKDVASSIVVVPFNDIEVVGEALDTGEIAAVILEPNGTHMGSVPVKRGFLEQLRDVTTKKGVILIFDEVVSGFRVAPGGMQSIVGVNPDLTTLAKILAGGLPGGAIGGRRELMQILAFKGDAKSNRWGRVQHQGTFNANPLSAAAGVAVLAEIAKGQVHDHCNRLTDELVEGLRQVLAERGVTGIVHGYRSLVYLFLGSGLTLDNVYSVNTFPMQKLQLAMLLNGVHMIRGTTFVLSGAHSSRDIHMTVAAFDSSIRRLQLECSL